MLELLLPVQAAAAYTVSAYVPAINSVWNSLGPVKLCQEVTAIDQTYCITYVGACKACHVLD